MFPHGSKLPQVCICSPVGDALVMSWVLPGAFMGVSSVTETLMSHLALLTGLGREWRLPGKETAFFPVSTGQRAATGAA